MEKGRRQQKKKQLNERPPKKLFFLHEKTQLLTIVQMSLGGRWCTSFFSDVDCNRLKSKWEKDRSYSRFQTLKTTKGSKNFHYQSDEIWCELILYDHFSPAIQFDSFPMRIAIIVFAGDHLNARTDPWTWEREVCCPVTTVNARIQLVSFCTNGVIVFG